MSAATVQTALIVAAGSGMRLRPLTEFTPKPLLKVGEKPLIQRSVDILESQGVDEIVVVVGFGQELVRDLLGDSVRYIENPEYESTNNMASLSMARTAVEGRPFLYLHSDLWYHPGIVAKALEAEGDICFLVERKQCGEEEMKVRIDEGLVTEADKSVPPVEAYGEWLGIAKFEPPGDAVYFDQVDVALEGSKMLYDCAVVRDLASAGTAIRGFDIDGLPWVEIDFADDLEYARSLAEMESL